MGRSRGVLDGWRSERRSCRCERFRSISGESFIFPTISMTGRRLAASLSRAAFATRDWSRPASHPLPSRVSGHVVNQRAGEFGGCHAWAAGSEGKEVCEDGECSLGGRSAPHPRSLSPFHGAREELFAMPFVRLNGISQVRQATVWGKTGCVFRLAILCHALRVVMRGGC
jgi:hypothetical protein